MSRSRSKKRRPKVWAIRFRAEDNRMWTIWLAVGNNGCVSDANSGASHLIGQPFNAVCERWKQESDGQFRATIVQNARVMLSR